MSIVRILTFLFLSLSFVFASAQTPNIQAVPAGITQGINYDADQTKVTLALLAPDKDYVYVVGDFTNWVEDNQYLMNLDPALDIFWLEITGLTPGQEYIYQYWIDGERKIGDPYADKMLDPVWDGNIPPNVYPNLIPYTRTDFGNATSFQTGQTPYQWPSSEDTYVRPDKDDLIVYELLVRDFVGSWYYQDLIDSLDYLERLGVNAIELLPIMEFEANESWGYNPIYFFAPDKRYGTKDDLKDFIAAAHARGMAVILDMVLNHAFGQSPMVGMYWDEAQQKPAADNPWFNPDPTHPFNVGYDFNHESLLTQAFVDSVNLYWLSEYHFDGYRFDLSKGFTQTFTDPDVAAWGQRDASRIALLKRMADKIWDFDPDAYVILEHFADASEENELAAEGMLLWGNLNHDFGDAGAGSTSPDLSRARDENRVTYMESHDEQRMTYRAITGGQQLGSYNIRDTLTALDRLKMMAAFFYTQKGPKMMWMFQELGYDIDINQNGRTGVKPQVWGPGSLEYYDDAERQKVYQVHSEIINLVRNNRAVFKTGTVNQVTVGAGRRINISHPSMDVTIIGNIGLDFIEFNPGFTKTGIWYDFFGNTSINVTDLGADFTLAPGEFYIYTTVQQPPTPDDLIFVFKPVVITEPATFDEDDEVRIIFDATAADPAGTAGLVGASKVYMHSGVILDSPTGTTWSNIRGNLGNDDGIGEMTPVAGETDKWEITITPRSYYQLSSTDNAYKLAMFFRDADDTNRGKGRNGKDIFIQLEPDPLVWVVPGYWTVNDDITIFFDARLADGAGTAGLVGSPKVYMHSGINTDTLNLAWTNVIGNWGMDDGVGEMSLVQGETDVWEISLRPRLYYNIPSSATTYRLGMVFRNANGSLEAKGIPGSVFEGGFVGGNGDIYINLPPFPTGIPEDDISSSVILYPNPADDMINLVFDNNATGMFRIRLLDYQGRIYSSDEFIKDSRQIDLSISSAGLKPGIYFLLINNDRQRILKKVIVQH